MATHDVLVKSNASYMLFAASLSPDFNQQLFDSLPLLHYSTHCWHYHLPLAESLSTDSDRDDLLLRFLRYNSIAWKLWLAVTHDQYIYGTLASIHEQSEAALNSFSNFFYHPVALLSGLGFRPSSL